MAAVTVRSDFGAQEEEICHYFHLSPSICHAVMGPDAMILVFLIFSFKLALSLSCFTLIKRLFRSSLLSVIRVVSSAYLRLMIFLPANLVLPYNSSSLAFHMMCSAYKLNKQPCCFSDIKIVNGINMSIDILFHISMMNTNNYYLKF